jgi:mRNA interferase RelE/StbE
MNFSIEFTGKAHKEWKRLPRAAKQQLTQTVNLLSNNPFTLDIKKLKTPFDGYRVRDGDYRILFTIEKKHIIIYAVTHRKDAYKM